MIKHLACIMDGNRRWARQHGWLATQGHREGVQTIKRVIAYCLKKNIPYVSLYTFSIENFKRSETEKGFLFDLIVSQAETALEEFCKQGIRVRFIGARELFPDRVKQACDHIEKVTEHNATLNLNFLFCYGARQEIVESVKAIVRKVQAGTLQESDISEDLISQQLWTYGIPEPDLIIRTGGARRLSNFLLYQAAYSEFYFFDCFWPELNETHLDEAVTSFGDSKRNFGS